MDQATIYSENHGLQKTDAYYVIENYLRLVTWKNDEFIIDVGCGDGDVTLELLLPNLPTGKVRKIVGADLSEEMLKFARQKCNDRDSRFHFTKMNIESCEYPIEFKENFDHIFSFYCLHWVMDQRQAVRNMYEILKPGGEMLLTFLASNPIYDIYENMAKSNKWSCYMTNLNKYISPYHHSKDPESEFESVLNKQGFVTHLCRVEHRTYVYQSFNMLKKSAMAVSPFVKNIPSKDLNSYIEDYVQEVRNLKSVTIEKCARNNNNDGEETIHVPYKLFVVFASKPI